MAAQKHADLIALAEQVSPDVLDDVVNDIVEGYGFSEVTEDGEEAEDGMVRWDRLAATVNSGGPAAQVKFLIGEIGVADTRTLLNDLVAESLA